LADEQETEQERGHLRFTFGVNGKRNTTTHFAILRKSAALFATVAAYRPPPAGRFAGDMHTSEKLLLSAIPVTGRTAAIMAGIGLRHRTNTC